MLYIWSCLAVRHRKRTRTDDVVALSKHVHIQSAISLPCRGQWPQSSCSWATWKVVHRARRSVFWAGISALSETGLKLTMRQRRWLWSEDGNTLCQARLSSCQSTNTNSGQYWACNRKDQASWNGCWCLGQRDWICWIAQGRRNLCTGYRCMGRWQCWLTRIYKIDWDQETISLIVVVFWRSFRKTIQASWNSGITIHG